MIFLINTGNISTNTTGIGTNATNITTNTNNITSNDTDITNLQTELDATQTGAGLGTGGSYTANSSANYIKTATSLTDADNKLDAQAKCNADGVTANTTNIGTNTGKFGTAGTVEASKAVVVDASRNITNFNNIQADGTITSGNSITIDGTGATQGSITESHGKISFGDETLVTTGNVGIGTSSPDATAILDLSSSAKGFLPPRLTSKQINAIVLPAEGLTVYNTTVRAIWWYNGTEWEMSKSKDGESCGDVTYSGHTYHSVIIGKQCWMTENLNVGTMIDVSYSQTMNSTIEKYCYSGVELICDVYGGLYQFGEMMQYSYTEGAQGICPTGWHVPSDDEWKQMEMALGMSQLSADETGPRGTDEGKKMKSTSGWYNNGNGTNSSGFNALPGGLTYNELFSNMASEGYWWSSSRRLDWQPWTRSLSYFDNKVDRDYANTLIGFSVRCLKN
nr:hypothetical protein [Bacteroidota bacterium]